MDEVKGSTGDAGIPSTVVFRLGTLGTVAADRFAAAIEPLDLKPKHVGLMASLAHGEASASQQELAGRLGVVPSLVVSLADHLERLGAVQRVRDPGDRRRQILTLTDQGRALLAQCTATARELDERFTAVLSAKQRAALQEALAILAAEAGLPTN
ncbi:MULTISPECIES: MarR family winged helix-turn-helix transcriptional regulator [Kitasatospora]|uniref:MarR family winged helix-turn-helix transcriptional regulator n=1 Tax=Kitasatospora TaxID=2063 RepID=UPI000C70D5BC|nr:MarR family transcriptional regulator [Kitasatospora sp. GP30]MDH6138817.1 DNA-binding MarR family transcriptional regulator [Kitasatospora sp. GP30]